MDTVNRGPANSSATSSAAGVTAKGAAHPALYVVDTSGFVFRAYHGLPYLSNSRGLPTNAVYGFAQMLVRLLSDEKPAYLALAMDPPGPSFRVQLDAGYKATRKPTPEDLIPQFPYVERLIDAFNLRRVSAPGFEADDVIATLTRRGRELGLRVVIVSSDKDLLQLVTADGSVVMLDTLKERLLGPDYVREKFGVGPEQLRDLLALMGDSSDNIPGAPGIGVKTAAQLLAEHASIDGLYTHLDAVKGRRRQALAEAEERVRLSQRLCTLEENVPLGIELEALRTPQPDLARLEPLLRELEFTRLLRQWTPTVTLDRTAYRTVVTREQLDELLVELRQSGEAAVDLETTSLDAVAAEIVGIAIASGRGVPCYIPLGHRYLGAPRQLEAAVVLDALRPLLEDAAFPKYAQNHKYEWMIFRRHGIELRGVGCDPMIASYLLDSSRSSHGLDALARDFLGHTMISYQEVCGRGAKQKGFAEIEVGEATRYAAEDADATLRLGRLLGPRVEADGLGQLLAGVEMPLTRVLGVMELRGVRVDSQHLGQLGERMESEIAALEASVRQVAGYPVNLGSPKQLGELLFDKLGLTASKRTKTGYSTDSEVLEELALEHPVAAQVSQHRTLAKLKSTYIDALIAMVNPTTGRVHTSYNQAVAATGRLSSSEPNLQNIPIRTELGRDIRRAFVADPGCLLLDADYSQIELRVLAHLSEDPVLVDAFARGEDVHQRTAREVFGLAAGEVTAEQRRVAKAVNFGTIFGQTDWGLSRQLGITQAQARAYIQSYFQRYAGVAAFMERTIAAARERAEVSTILGRRRPLPDIRSRNAAARSYSERIARNTPIQGSAADIIKLAMIRIQRRLEAERLATRMLLTVHDELLFEVPDAELEQARALVVEEMEGVMQLRVPLRVDVGVGRDWAEAH